MTQNNDPNLLRLHALIDKNHEWPGDYVFKFVVPEHKLPELKSHFEGHSVQTRSSANGRYVSLTYKGYFESSNQVIDIYAEVLKIEGVMAL